MHKNINHRSLEQLGIQVWEDKATSLAMGLVASRVCVFAKCLVLLYASEIVTHNLVEQKILDGMLSVLDLESHEIMCATILLPQADEPSIAQKIAQWQPKYILHLNSEVPVFNSLNCVQTYSPNYLAHNPQYKPQAYKSLLKLRAMLHGTSKCNS